MIHIVDPRQSSFYDPFEHILGPVALKHLREGWQGVFRSTLLELMPAGALADHFHQFLGRPTKELYSMAGLLFIMEFRNWTAEEAAEAYMFHTDLQFALNLEPALQSMCARTIERYRKHFREDEVAALVFERVTRTLVEQLELNVAKQRLDSTHVFSNMASFGRTQLMGVAIKRFLTQVKRHDREAYEALPEELRARYAPSANKLFGDTAKDTESRRLLRQQVAEDMHALLDCFAEDGGHCGRSTFLAMRRIFEEQCEVVEGKVSVQQHPGGRVMQNPSDPEATYDGKKGPGYQVQISETCSEDNEVQLVTGVLPQTAADSDAESVAPMMEQLKEAELLPGEVSADAAYGSDANVQTCEKEGAKLVSPVNASKRDGDKLHVDDFDIDPETEEVRTCPAGHAPIESAYDEEKGRTRTYMDGAHCGQCPNRNRCPVIGSGDRRRFDHTPGERRRAERFHEEQLPEFKERYAPRAGIEGTIGRIKRCTGMARLRVRGAPAVFNAIYLKIAGWNVLQAAKSKQMRQKVAQYIAKAHGNTLEQKPEDPSRVIFARFGTLATHLPDVTLENRSWPLRIAA